MLNFVNIGAAEMILLLAIVPAFILYIWAFVKCITNKTLSSTDRILWLLVIFVAPLLGAIAFLIVNRNKKPRPTQSAY
ncbi:PLDc N-terminal domain-containing protein [Albibacterium profundi]|uniref:PLDc N-terminal domain-containing protein n=1 Tax=Albibacterium profundi TaxID=3134906 RepID=UPI0035D02D48